MTSRNNKPIIEVKHLSKEYQIGMDRTYKRFTESFTNAVRHPVRTLRGLTGSKETFWALKDVNFEVERGEVLGIIGRNGAGKSTLLKILSRITYPTEGEIVMRGRVGSLLEVGTGFHPELTGRENIYFNGAILGMKKREIEDKFEEIVKFSGVEKFLDTPVKRYSSGMNVRLAFSVAAHLDPEILLVDEVLAVGDAEFQKKCLGKMGEVASEGRTVIFVSHNMGAVKALCSRGVVLDEGTIRVVGDPDTTIDQYLNKIHREIYNVPLSDRRRDKPVSLRAKILNLEIVSEKTRVIDALDGTKPFEIHLTIQAFKQVRLAVQIEIRNDSRTIILCSSELQQNKTFEFKPGIYKIICLLRPSLLASGEYRITCGLAVGPHEWIDYVVDAHQFSIKELDIYHNGFSLSQRDAVFHVNHSWEVQRGV